MSQPRHAPGRGPGAMVPGEKAKNFKGSSRKLLTYLRPFWVPMALVMFFAAASTVFSIAGPKVLAKAPTSWRRGSCAWSPAPGKASISDISARCC